MSSFNTIKYFQKNVYGNTLYYFSKQSKKDAEAFFAITGRKTLSKQDFEAMTKWGFKFEAVLPE